MNRYVGWILAAIFVALGWRLYGWAGIAMAATVVVFWLLLQFNRTLRVMKNAGHAPIGLVPSGVMLNAKLKPGMTMMDILHVTKSLGRELPNTPDTWEWRDEGGVTVTVTLPGGKLQSWHLSRPESSAPNDDSREDSGESSASP